MARDSCPASSPGSATATACTVPNDPEARVALQSEQAAARPVRQGHRRHVRVGPVAVRLRLRRPRQPQRRRLGGQHAQVGRHQPVLRLGYRPAAQREYADSSSTRRTSRASPRPTPTSRRRSRGTYAGIGAPGDHRAPQGTLGDHRDRADAGAPLRQRLHPDRQGPVQLLGLQHHRLLRARLEVRLVHTPGGQVQEFKAMVRALHEADIEVILDVVYNHTAEGNHMGPTLSMRGIDNAGLLPTRRGRQALLHGLHRHRQQPQRRQPARAAADHGLAALLGDRDARRRVPLRPRLDPGPRVLRRGQAVDLLRTRPAGPDGQPGQAHRRAVGRRPRWLPGRQLPAAVDRVERQVPRHGPGLLARRARHPRRVRVPPDGLGRPLRAHRPQAGRVDQLRHRPRRLHVARPGVLQREAQRGQRRGTTTTARATTSRGTAGSRARRTTRRSSRCAPSRYATS